MDNFYGYNNMASPALILFLTDDAFARNRFNGMTEFERSSFIRDTKGFQSKEELERYMYHKEHDGFR
ncbi:MAG: hypothetical protein ACK5JH_11990 [Anaerocolumna sp.]